MAMKAKFYPLLSLRVVTALAQFRSAVEITRTEDAHDQRMALLVFQSNELDERLARYGQKIIYNAINPEMRGYWQFLGRVDLRVTGFSMCPFLLRQLEKTSIFRLL